MWSILSALYPADNNTYRVRKHEKYQHSLNFEGIEFPETVRNINKFKSQNLVSVNVYVLKKYRNDLTVSPCHITSH